MVEFLPGILWAMLFIVPVVVYLALVGRADVTRGRVLGLTVVSGAVAGALAAGVSTALGGVSGGVAGLAYTLPSIVAGAQIGLVVGGLGLLARALGAWLSDRP